MVYGTCLIVDTTGGKGAEVMAHLGKYYGHQSLFLRTHSGTSGVVTYTCNPSTGEAGTGRSPGVCCLASQPSLLDECQTSKTPRYKKIKVGLIRQLTGQRYLPPKPGNLSSIPGKWRKLDPQKLSSEHHTCTVACPHPSPSHDALSSQHPEGQICEANIWPLHTHVYARMS